MTTRLYVGNLSPETTRDDLNSLFGQVALVISVEIENRLAAGCLGYVEVDAGNIGDVVFKLDITEVDGRRLSVQRTRPKSSAVSSAATSR
jgi:RNA recognition motif-containing protein